MSDILEEANKFCISPNNHSLETLYIVTNLSNEVERLRGLEVMVSKELFAGDGELTVEQFKAKKQIEFLQSQLLGAENLAEHWKLRALTVTSNRNKLQSQLAQMETERNTLRGVDLRQREALQELENKLAEAEEFIESQSKDICGYLNKIAAVEKEREGTKATFENSDKLIMSQAETIKNLETKNAELEAKYSEAEGYLFQYSQGKDKHALEEIKDLKERVEILQIYADNHPPY